MNTQLKELCSKVFGTYPKGVATDYFNYTSEIRDALESRELVTSDFIVRGKSLILEELMLSVIMSDVTSLYVDTNSLISVNNGELSDWPKELKEFVDISALGKCPKLEYWHQFAIWDEKDIETLQLFAESGRLLLRPIPKLLAPINNREVFIYPGSPTTPWLDSNIHARTSPIPLSKGVLTNDFQQLLVPISIPYINKISTKDFLSIIDDESDLLAGFRGSLKTLMKKSITERTTADEVLNDVVRPAVDRVQRRFRSISMIHGLKAAGATLSTGAICLVALTEAGLAASIAKVIGPAGLGLIGREVSEYIKSRDEMREMPMYMLWKLGRNNRK